MAHDGRVREPRPSYNLTCSTPKLYETESHAVCFAVCNLVFFLTKPNVVAHAVFSVCYDWSFIETI